MVLLAPVASTGLSLAYEQGGTLLFVGRRCHTRRRALFIESDNRRAERDVADHLSRQGCRRPVLNPWNTDLVRDIRTGHWPVRSIRGAVVRPELGTSRGRGSITFGSGTGHGPATWAGRPAARRHRGLERSHSARSTPASGRKWLGVLHLHRLRRPAQPSGRALARFDSYPLRCVRPSGHGSALETLGSRRECGSEARKPCCQHGVGTSVPASISPPRSPKGHKQRRP